MNDDKKLSPEELDKVSGGWNSNFHMDVVVGAWYKGDHRVFHVISRQGSSNLWYGDTYWLRENNTLVLEKANDKMYLSSFDYEHATEMVDPSIFTFN